MVFLCVENNDFAFSTVSADFRNIHSMSDHGKCMKFTGNFRPRFVADFPKSFGQFVDEQGYFAVAEFLVNPAGLAGLIEGTVVSNDRFSGGDLDDVRDGRRSNTIRVKGFATADFD